MVFRFFIFLAFLVFVTEIQAEPEKDRLNEIAESLSKGTYTHPDALDNRSVTIGRDYYEAKKINGWERGSCYKDKFDNTKICAMHNNDLMVSIYNSNISIYVGAEHFPRKSSAIKVDSNKTLYGVEGIFKNNNLILNQLMKGKVAYTRYVRWPYEYNVDSEISLDGFTEAYEDLRMRYSQLK